VYLLTAVDRKQPRINSNEFLLNHERLAKQCLGMAHVVTMPWELGYKWTELVGKEWSVFLGAVRTYRPGLDFETDTPFDHPRALPDRILGFVYGNRKSEDGFEDFLIDQSREHAATHAPDWAPCLSFADARTRRAEQSRRAATDESDWKALYEEEIESLREKIKQVEAEAEGYNNESMVAMRERNQAISENNQLRRHLDGLRAALEAKNEEPVDASITLPESYEDLPDWVDAHLTGRVVLHSRARRSLKNPEFQDVEQVSRALLLLANEYRNMKLGVGGGKGACDEKLAALGLRLDGSISKEAAGEFGDTYFVRWPFESSQKRFIDLHLRSGGNTRDPERCLAIYFFWDDETRQVVVCSLPGHLPNRLT
jgi:regulator of replication initiation timing